MSKYLLWVLILSISCLGLSLPSLAQTNDEELQAKPEQYHESALRRFEIVFTISLPFTALHSYLAVRGVQMIRQSKISPKLKEAHWNSMGGLTILFSASVAFWDYLHTRGEDIQDQGRLREQTEISAAMPGTGLRDQANLGDTRLRLLSARF
jgi:hypothetical protein